MTRRRGFVPRGIRRGLRGRSRAFGMQGSRGSGSNATNGVARMKGTDRVMDGSGEMIIGTITGGGFNADSIFMAPGAAGAVVTFPRMNQLAALYSEYRWVACSVRYRSFCGSTTAGRIAMASVYDPDDDTAPTAVNQLLATMPHVAGSVWKDHTLVVPCGRDNFQLNWYPCAILSASPNLNEECPFVVTVATDNGTDNNVGFLEVDWVIDFRNPVDPAMNPVAP